MFKVIRYSLILFVMLQCIYTFFVASSSRLQFWEIAFAFYVLYFSVFRIIIYNLGEEAIHDFFNNLNPNPNKGTSVRQFHSVDFDILAAILFFGLILCPFLSIISYLSTCIFQHFFSAANQFLSRSFPNVFLQFATALGLLINFYSFSRWVTKYARR